MRCWWLRQLNRECSPARKKCAPYRPSTCTGRHAHTSDARGYSLIRSRVTLIEHTPSTTILGTNVHFPVWKFSACPSVFVERMFLTMLWQVSWIATSCSRISSLFRSSEQKEVATTHTHVGALCFKWTPPSSSDIAQEFANMVCVLRERAVLDRFRESWVRFVIFFFSHSPDQEAKVRRLMSKSCASWRRRR